MSWAIVAACLAALMAGVPTPAAADDVDVVVTAEDGSSATAAAAVEAVGGIVSDELDLIGGVSAAVPESALAVLDVDAAVRSVTPDSGLQLLSSTDNWAEDDVLYTGTGSLYKTAKFIRIKKPWAAGYTGDGVDVALIDSGVVPVAGLDDPAKVINGPDLSFESQSDEFRYLDTYGHGTHMAGIIAGRDDGVTNPWKDSKKGKVVGIAPDARIVNVKVAGHDGAVDVSQVIAAIDWVVQHKNDNGMNIRVINLSFGTDSTQTAALDPLSFAVEQAWKAGIVVVVAAGNDGNGEALRMPASNPFVIAVGAFDSNGTNVTSDDFLTSFTNCGVGGREYDVLAPGRSIFSLRAPGSTADIEHPEAAYQGRFFRGSGTSQAAAVVSGAVAVMLEQRPDLTPDQVKELIVANNDHLGRPTGNGCERRAMLDMKGIYESSTPIADQDHDAAAGTGSLEASRGSDHVELDGVILEGEQDIMGTSWSGTSWSTAAAQGTSWSGGDWNGSSWTGSSWTGTSWSGTSWSGTSWSGSSWTGSSWTGTSWSNMAWNGSSWTGTSWSGTSWSGTSWSGTSWSGLSWGNLAML